MAKTNFSFKKVEGVYEADLTLTEAVRIHIERGDHTPVQCFETGYPGFKYAPSKDFNFDNQEPLVTVLNTSVFPAYLKLKCKKQPTVAFYTTNE